MNKAMLLKTAWKNSKTILGKKKKKNKIGELSLSSFKISYKVMVIKTVWYCIRIAIDHRQSLEFRNKPWPMVNWFLRKMLEQFNGETMFITLNHAGTIEYPHSKDEFSTLLQITYKH